MMLRRTCIFVALLSAYLIVLGHDLVPHHHHADLFKAVGHHHHIDHESSDDDHDQLPEFFANFVHAPYYPVSGSITVEAPAKIKEQPAAVLAEVRLIKLIETVLVSHHPPDNERSPSGFLSPSLSLRAPPAC